MIRKVLTATQLRANLFNLLEVIERTGSSVEYAHQKKVYKLWAEPTGRTTKRRYKLKKINPLTITEQECPDCHELMYAGICLNDDCKHMSLVR